MPKITKPIGEGFGKGELYAALAYDSSDAFGGMKIKGICIDITSTAITGNVCPVMITQSTGTSAADPRAIQGRQYLTGTFTGGTAYGIQGRLHFATGAIIQAAGGIVAAITAVITQAGTPTFTNGTVAGLYVENQCTTALTGFDGQSSLIRMANRTGAIDNVFDLNDENITNFLYIPNITAGTGCCIAQSAGTLTITEKLKVSIGGNVRYIAIGTIA